MDNDIEIHCKIILDIWRFQAEQSKWQTRFNLEYTTLCLVLISLVTILIVDIICSSYNWFIVFRNNRQSLPVKSRGQQLITMHSTFKRYSLFPLANPWFTTKSFQFYSRYICCFNSLLISNMVVAGIATIRVKDNFCNRINTKHHQLPY